MKKFRIKEVTKTRGNGTTVVHYYPQYLFRILWVFPVYLTFFDEEYNSLSDAQHAIDKQLRKYTSKKEVKIIPYNSGKSI